MLITRDYPAVFNAETRFIRRESRFLPRDAMHKRGLCRHAHAVSVCKSVRHVRELCGNG